MKRLRDFVPSVIFLRWVGLFVGVLVFAVLLLLVWLYVDTQKRLSNAETSTSVLAQQLKGLGVEPAVDVKSPPDPPVVIPGPTGPSGAPGLSIPGPRGPIGPAGRNGTNGANGQGRPGTAGADGVSKVGPPGPAGPLGPPGNDGAAGPAGQDGQPGKDGTDGKDGQPPASFTFTDPGTPAPGDETTYTCADPDGDGAYTCTPTGGTP